MDTEAAAAGFYKSPWGNHARLQILTISDLLSGKRIEYPPTLNVTLKRAPKLRAPVAEQLQLSSSDQIPRSPAKSDSKSK
jgi:hypothetical protein